MTNSFMFVVRRMFYSKEDNSLSPPFKLGMELISEKTWFHAIEYGSSNFSNSLSVKYFLDSFLYKCLLVFMS